MQGPGRCRNAPWSRQTSVRCESVDAEGGAESEADHPPAGRSSPRFRADGRLFRAADVQTVTDFQRKSLWPAPLPLDHGLWGRLSAAGRLWWLLLPSRPETKARRR